MKNIIAWMTMLVISGTVVAGTPAYWRNAETAEVKSLGEASVLTVKEKLVHIDITMLEQYLTQAPDENAGKPYLEFAMPMADGSVQRFLVCAVPVMHPDLQKKYPGIYTWAGKGIDDPYAVVRLDITQWGFHAMTLSPSGSVFIDPFNQKTRSVYKVYSKEDARKRVETAFCGFDPEESQNKLNADAIQQDVRNAVQAGYRGIPKSSGAQLRTYRAAVACTGEYTSYHGGTVPGALSAIVTSMNRVGGVYELEVAIRFTLIPNNDTLIFLSASSDPFTNNNGGAMLSENQTTVTNRIGINNYDIGHVFSTGGGGIAGLGVICIASQKARGVTGSPQPVNDPFDIDYVAHEIGHQFGGNHTFNATSGSCSGNGSTSTSFEPGSGTTIMAYAGICSGQNVQSNSNAYFHTGSFDNIVNFSTTSSGNNCPVITPTGNTPPVITSVGNNHAIPISTPFVLEGVASDPDGDPITYCWEQHDLGPFGSMASPSGNAPLFRSFTPTTSPIRYFPTIAKLVLNQASVGERLPTYARNMTFRLTVRDGRLNGGGVTYETAKVTLNVINTGAPFLVTAPNTNVTWVAGNQENVIWDVASTDVAPIGAANVDIFLSTDGGFTYPVTLASGVPNTGSAVITVPNNVTTTARVMVRGAGNVFFDISNTNFSITSTQGLANTLSSESVQVYPNPATGVLNLSLAGSLRGIVTADLMDAQGRVIQHVEFAKEAAGHVEQISLDGLAAGNYLLNVMTDAGSVVRKVNVY